MSNIKKFLYSFLITAFITLISLQLLTEFHKYSVISLMVTVLLCYLLGTAIHEIGHCFFAKLFGWKIQKISIGPFTWEPNKIRLSHTPNEWFGVCETMPLHGHIKKLRKELVFIYLGGPLVNLLMVLSIFLTNIISSTSTLFSEIFLLINLLLFASSIIPIQYGLVSSDGKVLLTLLNANNASIFIYNLLLKLHCIQSFRPKNWKNEYIEGLEKNSVLMNKINFTEKMTHNDLESAFYLIYYYFDTRRIEEFNRMFQNITGKETIKNNLHSYEYQMLYFLILSLAREIGLIKSEQLSTSLLMFKNRKLFNHYFYKKICIMIDYYGDQKEKAIYDINKLLKSIPNTTGMMIVEQESLQKILIEGSS